jgi:hypothetical protein
MNFTVSITNRDDHLPNGTARAHFGDGFAALCKGESLGGPAVVRIIRP